MKNFHAFFVILLTVLLTAFSPNVKGQSHVIDTTLSVLSADRPVGFPGKIFSLGQTIANLNYQVTTWNNDGKGVLGWFYLSTDTVLYGTSGGSNPVIYYKKTTDVNWTTVQSSWPTGQAATAVTVIPGTSISNTTWFFIGSTKIYKKVGLTGSLVEILNHGGNCIASNNIDTIYVSRGTGGNIWAYNINNFSSYTDLKFNLPNYTYYSIEYKNGKLITVDGFNVWQLVLGETSWSSLMTLNISDKLSRCTWMHSPNANQWDFALGSVDYNKINIYREVVAPSIVSANFTPSTILVNPGVMSESTNLSVSVSNNPTAVWADFSVLGGSDSVSLTKVGNVWSISGSFPNATVGEKSINVIASNSKGSNSLLTTLTVVRNGKPTWVNVTDTVSVLQNTQGSYTIQYTDPNGHSVNVSWISVPSFLSTNGNTISGTGTVPGVYPVSVRLVDSMQDSTIVNLQWEITLVNQAPQFTSLNHDPAGFKTRGYSGSFSASDGNGHPITATLTSSLNGYVITGSNPWTISGTPTVSGTDTLRVRLNDGFGGIADSTWVIRVWNDHCDLPDSINSNTTWIQEPEGPWFRLSMPRDGFSTYYSFSYNSFQLTSIDSIRFNTTPDSLIILIKVAENPVPASFRIRVLNNGSNWFESQFLSLKTPNAHVQIISVDITQILHPGDVINTQVLSGNTTSWRTRRIIGDTVVSQFTSNQTGLFSESITIQDSWLKHNNRSSEDSIQNFKIEVTNGSLTVIRNFRVFDSTYVTAVRVENSGIPTTFNLSQNYPNPFNPSTRIAFGLPESGEVSLKVYDLLGKTVAVLVEGFREAGTYSVQFDARNLSGGVYFYELNAGSFRDVKKLTLLK